MVEVHWKRGVPTEDECRECVLIEGGVGDEPYVCRKVHPPGLWTPVAWGSEAWYSAVRILPQVPALQESQTVEQTPEGPQPGQFWKTSDGCRRLILAVTSRGDFACERPDGTVSRGCREIILKTWKHLPWCKSFEDIEPKKTKKQRKWVCQHGEAWIDIDGDHFPLIAHFWARTDDVREVPL